MSKHLLPLTYMQSGGTQKELESGLPLQKMHPSWRISIQTVEISHETLLKHFPLLKLYLVNI